MVDVSSLNRGAKAVVQLALAGASEVLKVPRELKKMLPALAFVGVSMSVGVVSSVGNTAQAAVNLSNRMQSMQLVVAVDPKNPPFAELFNDFGHPEGFDIDVVYELQRRLGFDLKENRFFPMDSRAGFKMLKEKRVDLLIGGNVYNEKLGESFDHSKPVYSSGLGVMYSRDHNGVRSAHDLKGKKVGVKHNSSAEEYVSKVLGGTPVLFDNIILAYYELSSGGIDAVVSDWPSLNYFSLCMPDFKLGMTEDIFDIQNGQFVYYLPKNSPYTGLINMAISQMEADGTMYRLKKKWID